MDKTQLQAEITKLLGRSSISDHDKEMVRILLPVMKLDVLQNTFEALRLEREENDKLDLQESRVKLKYKIMVDSINHHHSKK